MLCVKCGSPIPDGYSNCPYCGSTPDSSFVQPSAQPVMQPEQSTPFVRKNGMATAGLVCGIIAAALYMIVIVSGLKDSADMILALAIHPQILGVVFSSVGIAKSRIFGSKGRAIAGLIISICASVLMIIAMAVSS